MIRLYKGTITAGETNGTEVSQDGAQTNPVQFGPLNASENQIGDPKKMGVRCDSGYATFGATTLSLEGATSVMWRLAPDNEGAPGTFEDWGASLEIGPSIADTNVVIWIQAKAEDTETILNDIDVNVGISTRVYQV